MLRRADPKEKLTALVFKLQSDAFVGSLAFVRVYSGVLGLGQKFFNPRQKKTEKLSKLLKLHANKREEVRQLGAGEIGAVVGLKFTRTGDTLCEADDNIVLENIAFPEPVIGIAIEAKTKADEETAKDEDSKNENSKNKDSKSNTHNGKSGNKEEESGSEKTGSSKNHTGDNSEKNSSEKSSSKNTSEKNSSHDNSKSSSGKSKSN